MSSHDEVAIVGECAMCGAFIYQDEQYTYEQYTYDEFRGTMICVECEESDY